MFLREHEKFIAFVLLGAALVAIAFMVYLKPPSAAIIQNGAALAILNTIVGALTLAFGGAANALFKISGSEKKEIGEATAAAMRVGEPIKTEVTNTPDKPVQAEITSDEGLPVYAR